MFNPYEPRHVGVFWAMVGNLVETVAMAVLANGTYTTQT